MTNPPLIFLAHAGLANRLRALVGYRTLAERSGRRLVVHWPNERACPAGFLDLFERSGWEDVEFATPDQRKKLEREYPGAVHRDVDWWRTIWRKHGRELTDMQEFSDRSLEHLRSLVPVAGIRDRIEAFFAEKDLRVATGFHLRLTDNMVDGSVWSEGADLDRMGIPQLVDLSARIGESLAKGEPVFLCTDNPDARSLLLARHPGVWVRPTRFDRGASGTFRMVKASKRTGLGGLLARVALAWNAGSRSLRTTSMEDAVADLWLLSRCRTLVRTGGSFGALAAELGGIPCEVIPSARHEAAERWSAGT